MAKKHETPNPDAQPQPELTLAELVGKLGVKADMHGDDLKMTMPQYDKLLSVIPGAEFVKLLPKEGRVVVAVKRAEAESAVAANKRIPRQAVNTEIIARMVYSVNAPESTNRVTMAWWEAETDTGVITVNDVHYPINTGIAAEFYSDEDEELTDPERKVYYVDLPLPDGASARLTSYGVTNLIRRVTALRSMVG
jgi:hypothetical protein